MNEITQYGNFKVGDKVKTDLGKGIIKRITNNWWGYELSVKLKGKEVSFLPKEVKPIKEKQLNEKFLLASIYIVSAMIISMIVIINYDNYRAEYSAKSYDFKTPINEDNYRDYTVFVRQEIEDTLNSEWTDNSRETLLCFYGNVTGNNIYLNKIRRAYIKESSSVDVTGVCYYGNIDDDYFLGIIHSHPIGSICFPSDFDVKHEINSKKEIVNGVMCRDFYTDKIIYNLFSKRSAMNKIPLKKVIVV